MSRINPRRDNNEPPSQSLTGDRSGDDEMIQDEPKERRSLLRAEAEPATASQLQGEQTTAHFDPSSPISTVLSPSYQPQDKQPASPSFAQRQSQPPSRTQTEEAGKNDVHDSRPKRLQVKAIATALIVGMLPTLALGTATYYFGNKALDEQLTEARRSGVVLDETRREQQQWLMTLLIGTGATALLAGAIAAVWANRTIRWAKAMSQARTPEDETKRLLARYAQLEQEAATERQWTQYFVEAAQRIHGSFKQEEVLQTSVEEVRQVLGCDRVVVYGLEEGLREVIVAESVARGYPKALGLTINDPCFEARYIEKYEHGLVTTIDNVYEAKLTPCYIEQLETLAVRANLVAPILQEGTLMGLLIAHQCSGPRHWQQFEIRWFAQMAMQIGFALDNVRLLGNYSRMEQQVETERQWTQYFTVAAQRVHASLNEKDVLTTSVEEVRRVLGCDRVVVYGLEESSRAVVIAESVAPGFPRALGMTINDPCFDAKYLEKYQNGRVKALDNIYEAGLTSCYIEQLETIGVQANLVAPIINEGKLLGLLIAHQCSGPRRWQPFEISWFAQMAMQVGFALDKAKLLSSSQADDEQRDQVMKRILKLLQEGEAAVTAFAGEARRQSEAMSALDVQGSDADRLVATAQQLERQTEQSEREVGNGQETTSRCVESVGKIYQAVADAVDKVSYLSHSTQKNREVIDLIHQLAEQLHNEVLNVAIQTGRSGHVDQAAVMAIAETVRSLTQQLAELCSQAQPLATEVDREVKEAAALMETGANLSLDGTELVKLLKQQLDRVAAANEQTSALVKEIGQAATEQTQTATDNHQTVQEFVSLAAQSAKQSEAVAERWQQLSTAAQVHADEEPRPGS